MDKSEFDNLVIYELMRKFDKTFNKNYQKSVLFIGITGVGKSTLLNYISEDKNLLSKPYKDGYMFEGGNFKITNTPASCTDIPKNWQVGNTHYWDIPGLQDNRSFNTEILNSYYISKICSLSDQYKIVFVINRFHIRDRDNSSSFGQFIKQINVPEVYRGCFSDSMSIIITKGSSNCKIEHILEEFQNIKESDLFPEFIIDTFIEKCKSEKISFFPQPTYEGPPDASFRSKILTMIDSTMFIKQEWTPLVSSECGHDVHNQIQILKEESHRHLDQKINNFILSKSIQDLVVFLTSIRTKKFQTVLEFIEFLGIDPSYINKRIERAKFLQKFVREVYFSEALFIEVVFECFKSKLQENIEAQEKARERLIKENNEINKINESQKEKKSITKDTLKFVAVAGVLTAGVAGGALLVSAIPFAAIGAGITATGAEITAIAATYIPHISAFLVTTIGPYAKKILKSPNGLAILSGIANAFYRR